MGRSPTSEVLAQFTFLERKHGCLIAAVCKHCGFITAKNITRNACYLACCLPYLKQRCGKIEGLLTKGGQAARIHQTAIAHRLTEKTKDRLNNLTLLMIYKGGLPFTFFKRPEVRSFLTALNSAYKAPSARYCGSMVIVRLEWLIAVGAGFQEI